MKLTNRNLFVNKIRLIRKYWDPFVRLKLFWLCRVFDICGGEEALMKRNNFIGIPETGTDISKLFFFLLRPRAYPHKD